MGIKKEKKVKRHGARMIKGLTADLYDEIPMVCREYISNAADIKANSIRITVNKPNYDKLIFSDDGEGMDEEGIEEATNIMISNKIYDPSYPPIGKFGIGIYAGGKVCTHIVIRTKKKNENIVRFTYIPIEQWFEEGEKDLSKDITDVTKYDYEEEELDSLDSEQIASSYTIIELRNLKPFARDYLKNNMQDLKLKLGHYAPLKFRYEDLKPLDPNDFKKELSSGISEEILKQKFINWLVERVETNKFCDCEIAPQYNNLTVFVEDEELYRPVPKENFIHPYYWKEKILYDMDENPIGYAWVALRDYNILAHKTSLRHGLYKELEFRGLSLRLWNVAVYSPESLQIALGMKTASATYGRWWGEVYLMDPDLKLNLARNNILAESKNWEFIKEQLSEWIRKLQKISEGTKKKPGKVEIFGRLEIFKSRGLNPSDKFLKDVYEAAGEKFPEPSKEEKPEEVAEEKLEEVAEERLEEVAEERLEEVAEERLEEVAEEKPEEVTEEKTEEITEEKDDLVDEEVEIKTAIEYANILINRYNLLGLSKGLIEEIGKFYESKSNVSWNDLFVYLEGIIENYIKLHP